MKHVVIKIGSSTLVKDGKIDAVFMGHLASECANLMHDEGIQPIIVSSGSIALGLEVLGIHGDRPDDMPTLQAAASIGQVGLIRQYTDTFACFGVTVGQILMTRATTGQRESYLHARDTIERLLELGVVPIINENDTVAVEEIRFGDNDTLAAMVATCVNADLVVLLSDIDGLYTADPRKNEDAELLNTVSKMSEEIESGAGGVGSRSGSVACSPRSRPRVCSWQQAFRWSSARAIVVEPLPMRCMGARSARPSSTRARTDLRRASRGLRSVAR